MSIDRKRNVYVGHRYVPKVMGEWDNEQSYEGLSIVTHKGTSYTSKKAVPVGVDILDEEYWVVTGNYNAQIEQYRKDVRDLETYVDNKLEDINNDLEKVNSNVDQIAVNVKSFGAKGDGVTDDFQAIKNAISFLESNGGGKLIFPSGYYLFDGTIDLISNLHVEIQAGAVLKRMTGGIYFNFPSHSKGYDGGLKNIVIDGGGTIRGDFERNYGVVMALHHTKNLTVRNITFYECITTSHVFDLCGCSNIVIDNCYFYGMKFMGNRGYVEAIQIDYSAYPALSNKNENERSNVDGLTTKNVTVNNCKFLPIYHELGIEYYAPNPIGNHVQYGFEYHKNIYFTNNIVENVIPESITGETQGTLAGAIHLVMVDNLVIDNNVFINTTNMRKFVIYLGSFREIRTIESIAMDEPQTYIPEKSEYKGSRNITISNNKFDGFIHHDGSISPSFRIVGREKGVGEVKNLKIIDNEFTNFLSLNDYVNERNVKQDIFHLSYCDGVKIIGNHCDLIKRLVHMYSCNNVYIGSNTLDRVGYICFSSSANEPNTLTIIENNIVSKSKGFARLNCETIIVRGNKYDDVDTLDVDGSIPDNRTLNLYNVGNIIVSENTFISTREQRGGVFVEGTGTKGYIINNNIIGYEYEVSTSSVIDGDIKTNEDIYTTEGE